VQTCRTIAPPLLAALLALAAAPPARAQGVEGLLPPVVGAAYRGRKVLIDFTRQGPQVSSMTVLCQPDGRERREFHATRSLLLVDGESTWQYLPDQRIVLKRRSRGEGGEILRPEQVRRALDSYDVRGLPAEAIAGRRTRGLEFLPRQSGSRPRRKVWVDAETGLVLRTEVYGTDSRLAWLAVFEDLEYHPRVDRAAFTMQVPSGARVVESAPEPCLEPAEAERASGLRVALPSYLPQGFARQCVRVRRRAGAGEVQVTFGDGLSLLSLFISGSFRAPGGTPSQPVAVGTWPGQWHEMGLVTGISWRTPWAHLALLGELSREELRLVAASVGDRPELSRTVAHP
jgi:outer membrane lipoprotein-sorting protein